jgi:hypothetical protein
LVFINRFQTLPKLFSPFATTKFMQKLFTKTLLILLLIVSIFTTQAQVINTYVGTGVAGYSGDAGLGVNAKINNPFGLAKDANGNLFIVDSYNGCIRKVTADGIITTVAGTGTIGYSGDGGPATAAKLNYPTAVATDAAGNIYISDYANSRIRKVTVSTGIITTVAGNGTNSFSGDGAAATSATISTPFGIAIDASNNIYFADQGNFRIRKITASTGFISTICGNGTNSFTGDAGLASAATISDVHALALDASGNIYFGMSNRIRKINASTNIVNTIVGNGTAGFSGDGAAASAATVNAVREICFDNVGNMYFSDFANNRIRKVNTSNIISTISGTGVSSSTGDGGLPASATLNLPYGIVVNSTLNKIYIAEQGASKIRVISPQNGLHFAGALGQLTPVATAVDDQITVPHNAALNVTNFTFEAWVNPNNNANNTILSKGGVNGSSIDGSYAFQLQNGYPSVYRGAGPLAWLQSTTAVCANVWSHVAVTFNATTKDLKFYINGQFINTVPNYTTPNPGNGPLGIGVQGHGLSPIDPCNCNRFNGSMDDIRIWNVTRTNADILNSFNKELIGNEAGLILYYPFNMGVANASNTTLTTAYDATGNGNNGTLQGFNLSGTTSNYIAPNNVTTLGCTAEIEVKGNSIDICSGSSAASTTNNTDWGNVALGSAQTKEFFIKNLGTTVLNITGVSITGTNASDFSILYPSGALAINAYNVSQLWVDCTPSATGTRTATLNIFSNDCDEPTFTFALQASACTPSLANSGDTKTAGFGINYNIMPTGTCRVIADLVSYSFQVTNVLTKVTVDATVQTSGSQPYVQRHYDIEPSVNASTGSGYVTLYYSQAEFTAFNAHPNSILDLPTSAADATGIANLRITQYHGTGTNPTNYTGSSELINPTDANIVWEAAYSRWKVTFYVTGFSGFYLHTGASVLPIKLISFTGEIQNNKASLSWEITQPENNTTYILQRSQNTTQFYDINTQAGTNAKTLFNHIDIDFSNNAYYRLKIIDADGKITYSNIIRLSVKQISETFIYPNPVQHTATLEVNDKKLIGTVANLLSVNGAVLQKITIKNRFEIIDLSMLPAGIYLLQTNNGAVQKIIKN